MSLEARGWALLTVACVLAIATVAGVALAAAGQLDQSFSGDGRKTTSFTNGPFSDYGYAVAIQANGQIVVAGSADPGSATSDDFGVARFLATGGLDPSFSSDGRRTTGFSNPSGSDEGYGVAIQPNGRIVVAGQSDQGSGTEVDFAVARFLPGGGLDPSFSGDGRRTTGFANDTGTDAGQGVAIQPNGRIVVVGRSDQGTGTGNDFAVARFLPAGGLDPSFSGDGKRTTGFANAAGFDFGKDVALQQNGRIVVAGSSNQGSGTGNDFALARFLPGGGLDPSFSDDGKKTTSFGSGDTSDLGNAVALQGNGRIVVAGESTQTGAGMSFAIARYMPNGRLDQSFSGNGKRSISFLNGTDPDGAAAVAIQPNGRIVVAGYSDQGMATTGNDFAVARLMPDGSLDKSFSIDGRRTTAFANDAFNDFGDGVALQPNGRIVVAGFSGQSGTGVDFAVARFLGG